MALPTQAERLASLRVRWSRLRTQFVWPLIRPLRTLIVPLLSRRAMLSTVAVEVTSTIMMVSTITSVEKTAMKTARLSFPVLLCTSSPTFPFLPFLPPQDVLVSASV